LIVDLETCAEAVVVVIDFALSTAALVASVKTLVAGRLATAAAAVVVDLRLAVFVGASYS